ncbi:hypothetical protein FVEG_02024 [Fusarium verticillioides 7600]|uniref:Uncharacterized protein n=1 Tax=Gibberella moniliformis (strain M3125 / FGSC 7600) TaxID=334819 RepID=W7LU67_GIBM7|nr:hypothetical protein FVEG_02024 [Fusarium verticillioides 7600]EWG38994.1 hypothetical protein FVEG_02024 [Fusarium verticillioides 7600]
MPFRIGSTSHQLVWVRTTLSEYAKRLARENPAEWNDYLDAYHQKITDPKAFILNQDDNEQHARQLLIYAASLTVIVGCTPVAFGQIKNHTGLEYNFIDLNEAAGMPESLSLIPVAKCPRHHFFLSETISNSGPSWRHWTARTGSRSLAFSMPQACLNALRNQTPCCLG